MSADVRGYMKLHLDQRSYEQKASKQSLDRTDYSSLLSIPSAAAAASLHTAERLNISFSFLHHRLVSMVLYW